MFYLKLYFTFLKIGLFSVGGGLATLPFLQDMADTYGWLTQEELVNMIAISESTPGAIGINTATFVGYEATSLIGGIIATLGIVTPSIIIITLIAHYFKKFNETTLVKGAFFGIRPAVTGLIASVGAQVLKISVLNLGKYSLGENILKLINIKEMLFFIIVMFLIYRYKKHPVIYLALAAVFGIVFKL